LGADYIDLPLASKSVNPFNDLRTLYALWRIYRKLQPDLIFHYTIKPNIYGSLAAMLARVKSIAVTTGLGYVFIRQAAPPKSPSCYIGWRSDFHVKSGSSIPMTGDFLKQNLLAHPDAPCCWPGEGIDSINSIKPLPAARQHFNFILIGRLLWDKGWEYVAAARQLKRIYRTRAFCCWGPQIANPAPSSRVMN